MSKLEKIIDFQYFLLGVPTDEWIAEIDWLRIALQCGPAEYDELRARIAWIEHELASGQCRDAGTVAHHRKYLHFYRTLVRLMDDERGLLEDEKRQSDSEPAMVRGRQRIRSL